MQLINSLLLLLLFSIHYSRKKLRNNRLEIVNLHTATHISANQVNKTTFHVRNNDTILDNFECPLTNKILSG